MPMPWTLIPASMLDSEVFILHSFLGNKEKFMKESRLGAVGLGAAFFASCCSFPATLAVMGIGMTAGTASFLRAFDPYRPYLIAVAGLVFGYTFFRIIKKRDACSTLSKGRTMALLVGMLLLSSVLVGLPLLRKLL